MNLRQLEYFVHVAELGSFSKAALVLGIAQPALSRQVRALEADLRETLLLRNGRGVELTEAGRRMYRHGTDILQMVRQAQAEMAGSRDEPSGGITIGLPPTLGRQLTLPLVEAFKRGLPRARLSIVEGLSAHIVEWIVTGRVDVGLLYNPDAHPGLEITPLLQEPLGLVSARNNANGRSRGQAMPLAELVGLPLVLPERAHVVRRLLDTQAARAGLKLDIAWEVSSVPAIVDLVAAGYGHAVLTAGAVQASGRAAQLQLRPLEQPELTSVLCMAGSAHRRATPLARRAQTVLQALVKAHVAQSPPAATPSG